MLPGHKMFLSSLGICRFGDWPGSVQASLQGASPQLFIPGAISVPTRNRTEGHQLSPFVTKTSWVVGREQGSFPSLSPSLCCRDLETGVCSSSDGISDEPVGTQTVHGSLKPLPFINELPDMLWDWKIPKNSCQYVRVWYKTMATVCHTWNSVVSLRFRNMSHALKNY